MIDSLVEILTILKDYIIGLLKGMWQLVASLGFVLRLQGNITWLPTFMFTIMSVSALLIVIFRILGR